MPIEFRPTKGRGGIGGYRNPGAKVKKIKQVSPKQRKRTATLHDKLEVMLRIQDRIYGKRICEASRGHEKWKFRCPSLDKRFYPLVLDHQETRNQEDADRYENSQVLCSWCNYQKGSVRGLDFRSKEMVLALKAEDVKEAERNRISKTHFPT